MNTDTEQLIRQFRAFADPVRLRLLVLCGHGEASVSELTEVLSLSQPRISQHLKALCDARLLERFRDGHYVYYRLPSAGAARARVNDLLAMLPTTETGFERDIVRLRGLRGANRAELASDDDRPLQRALVELTVAMPLGDLLDIGCGQGKLLKLLASRTTRAVGVDIDADARRFARAELLLAGLPNCTLRKADMYALPFADQEFDTVILDDVLRNARDPLNALIEAARMVRHGGRVLLLNRLVKDERKETTSQLASWSAAAGLRLGPPRAVPSKAPRWLLAVATPLEQTAAA
jgi:ArsR family transcriptional regulator